MKTKKGEKLLFTNRNQKKKKGKKSVPYFIFYSQLTVVSFYLTTCTCGVDPTLLLFFPSPSIPYYPFLPPSSFLLFFFSLSVSLSISPHSLAFCISIFIFSLTLSLSRYISLCTSSISEHPSPCFHYYFYYLLYVVNFTFIIFFFFLFIFSFINVM